MKNPNERGAALISILLLLIIMSALSAALTISTRTEVMVAKNRSSAAQARAAAESGLNHASEVTITYLNDWPLNGFQNASGAMTRLLRGPDDASGTTATDADNGSLESYGVPRPPTRLGLNNVPGVGYEARLYDEDDPARGTTLNAADRTAINEQVLVADPYLDLNSRIVVRAVGYANDGTSLTLEGTISKMLLPAVLTDGDLTINGNVGLTGSNGGVHSNDDLDLNGSAIDIEKNATASGGYSVSGSPDIGGVSGGGRPTMAIPTFDAATYRPLADYILGADGRIRNQAGTMVCNASGSASNCEANYGWHYDGPGWSINNGCPSAPTQVPLGATFYVEGAVRITGSGGGVRRITILAEGSIDISGSATFRPNAPDIMFVTDGDLDCSGSFSMQAGIEGRILIKEQFDIGGNIDVYGQIIAAGRRRRERPGDGESSPRQR